MPTIDSPLGSKKITGQQYKEYDVPDESDFAETSVNPVYNRDRRRQQEIQNFQSSLPSEEELAAVERDMHMARQARRTGQERLNDGAKRRIELLTGMTRMTRQCDIEGNSFVFQSLKSKEMSEAILLASAYDGTVQSPFEIRRQLLSRALIEISGIPVNEFLGSNDMNAKLAFIDELDDILLNRLYDEYLALNKECKEKYSIKTEQDVKDLVEDLKK